MNFLKKLTIPFLLLALISLMYIYYFSDKGLGSFSSFDTNNNANREIRVKVIHENGFSTNTANGTVTFYAEDRDGIRYPVQAPATGKPESAAQVVLTGHLHEDHFHATGIETD